MLSSWGVCFEAIDVEAEPAAMDLLRSLGVPRVPAVVVGDQVVHGWNPRKVAALVGIDYIEPAHLSTDELRQRLDRMLAAAQAAIRQFPAERLQEKTPGRNRTVRQLGYHIFRLALALRDGIEGGEYPEAWIDEQAPPEIVDGEDIARYGQRVRACLQKWFGQARWTGEVHTYYGPQTAYELLERTVWHVAQHVRQLSVLLEQTGIPPSLPLSEADWQGLPLPQEIW
ncbi:MAG: hypothetical protein D6736_14525 [Nitrospinota bacterium]|nr:MAG: hypothetical protein D6736_14525 [Nitrospinota bacterium]